MSHLAFSVPVESKIFIYGHRPGCSPMLSSSIIMINPSLHLVLRFVCPKKKAVLADLSWVQGPPLSPYSWYAVLRRLRFV